MAREVIIKNKIRCNNCQDIIESTHRHEFVVCKCWDEDKRTGCAVDGGKDYRRRLGTNYTDISEVKEMCRKCGEEENVGFGYCRACAIKLGADIKEAKDET